MDGGKMMTNAGKGTHLFHIIFILFLRCLSNVDKNHVCITHIVTLIIDCQLLCHNIKNGIKLDGKEINLSVIDDNIQLRFLYLQNH